MAHGVAQQIGGDAKEIGLGIVETLLGHDLGELQPGILRQVLGQRATAAEAREVGDQLLAMMDVTLQAGIGNLVVVAHGSVPPRGATKLSQMRTVRNCRLNAGTPVGAYPSSGRDRKSTRLNSRH